jgi:hypothetical protein
VHVSQAEKMDKKHCYAQPCACRPRGDAEAAFLHYDGLLGTNVDRNHTLDFALLVESQELQDLDEE